MPFSLTRDQVLSFGKSLLERDPEEGRIIAQGVKGVWANVFSRESPDFHKR